jgi:tRNA threonylcarbamoyladenosine biosynthesis protein TsaB
MRLLALDTATPATVVGVYAGGGAAIERRHDPLPGERPGHVSQVLALAEDALAEAGLRWADLDRIGVGVGPGSFTGLRIGVATARALGQATGAPLVAVSTLGALAEGARLARNAPVVEAFNPSGGARPVLAVLDARRGEAFAGAWLGVERVLAPAAVAPEALAALVEGLPGRVAERSRERGAEPLVGAPLAVGDGAVRFRAHLEPAGAEVPEDGSPLHRVGADGLCRLAADAPVVSRDRLAPEYVRAPDATPREARR